MKEILTLKRMGLERHIKEEFPTFEYIDKRNSFLMKCLSKLLFFNKEFMTRYITVIGAKVYVPQMPWKPNAPYTACEVMAHEWVHMKDSKTFGPLFKFLYLFPQILAPLALLAFWKWWMIFFIVCAAPIPAPFRAWFEFRAYTVSIAVRWWLLQQEYNPEWLTKQFTSSSYYWMLPAEKFLKRKFAEELQRIKEDKLKDYEKEIKSALKI